MRAHRIHRRFFTTSMEEGLNPLFLSMTSIGIILIALVSFFMITSDRFHATGQTINSIRLPSWAIQEDDEQCDDEYNAQEKPLEKELPQLIEPKSTGDIRRMIKEDWEALQQIFAAEGIAVDLDKKLVEVKGAIIRDKRSSQYPIEYIVVSEGGSTHEAMILIKATPSMLNAALLALGLEPGQTVSYKLKDPPPPQEDVDAGRTSRYEVIPPKGTLVYIYVKYDGWGERHTKYLEDLIIDLRTGKPMDRLGWIYVGSRFARVLLGRDRVIKYMADMERNVVACYLTGFGNAILDINSPDGINDSLYDVNPDAAPPMYSKVSVIFAMNPL